MGGESDNFLPPWLQGADEPDNEPEPRQDYPDEPDEVADQAPAESADDLVPPWLRNDEPIPEPNSFAQTMGVSQEYLDSADTLPETAHGDLSYDEWLQIQQEATRERSVEEEIPDLLSDDTSPTSPFFAGTISPAATGELPDWFLGLEELDESDAPDWFVAQGGDSSPSTGTVEAALVGSMDSDDALSLSDEDEWDLPIDPDDVGDVSLDSGTSGVSAFRDDPLTDDPMASFFDGISRQREEAPSPGADFVSDWATEPQAAPSPPDDDFYAEYASLDAVPDEDEAMDAGGSSSSIHFHERRSAPDDQFEESLLDTNPTPDQAEVSHALHAADYDEPDLSAFADADLAEEPVSAAPVQDIDDDNLDSESLSWLNEINSMVSSVTHDPDDFGMNFDDTFSAEEADSEAEQSYFFPNAEPESESQPLDWLTELQGPDSEQSETGEQNGGTAADSARVQAQPSRPVIDFSTMDFDDFQSEESYEEASATHDDTYDDLFANLQKQPEAPASTPENTSGATVILSPDTLPPQSENEEEPQITSSAARDEKRRSYVTDELDAMLFGEDVTSSELISNRASQAHDAGGSPEVDDDYRILEQLSHASSSGQSWAEPADEDLAWLRDVSFDDDLEDAKTGASAGAEAGAGESPLSPEPAHAAVEDLVDLPVEDVDARTEDAWDFVSVEATTASPSTSQEADDLLSLLDNLGAGDAAGDDPDAAFDAMFSDVEAEPFGDVTDSGPRIRVETSELNALFGDSEASEEVSLPGDEAVPSQSATMTGSPVHDVREQETTQPEQLMPHNDDFDAIFGGMNEPPEDESESLPDGGFNADDEGEMAEFASDDGEFDDLFSSLDSSLEDYPAQELPPEAGQPDSDDAQSQGSRIAANTGDLEALFAAFEDEHRDESADLPTGVEADETLDFPDDDSFFAAMGLSDEPDEPEAYSEPEDEAQPPPDEEEQDTTGPDLDFLEGFGQPEMNKTTVISGEENTSMWEEPETTEEQPEVELPAVPAFAFDDSDLPDETIGQDDWFDESPVDDFAPEPVDSDEYAAEMAGAEATEAQNIDDVPGWLQDIDTSSMAGVSDETASEAAAALFGDDSEGGNLEDFIAGLDAPEAVLPQRNEYAEPGSDVDDFDLEAVFDQALSDATDNETPADTSGLEQSDMLSELQASVGAVSAAALARQMEDRPESELSDRLQKLRKRTTDEVKAAQAQDEGDDLSQVLPGVDDALVPVPVATEPGEFFDGVSLSAQQRAQVALLSDLIGSGDEPIQMRGTNRLSAIDLTYEGMHQHDEDAEDERAATKAETPTRKRMRRRRTYRIDRLLLTVLLAAGIIVPFFINDFRIGALPPSQFALGSQESHAFDQIDKLEQYDLVMVGLEYGPASAGELDQLADSIIRHVLLRGARPVFVSGNAFGVLRAQYFLDAVNTDRAFLQRINQRVPMEANVEYYTARFLPGGAVGLRAFSEATSGLLTYDINGQTESLNLESLSNLALIIMVTDRAEDVRAYAEQVAPLASRPLVVGVSYAAAPLAEPYARNENAVRGLLVGYEDAYTYHSLLDTVDAVSRGARPVRPTIIAPTPDAPDETPVEGVATGEPSTAATSVPGDQETPLESPTEAPAAESLPNAIVVSANGANLRSGPGTDFRVVAGMARNTSVIVLAYNDTGDWVNVRLDDGTEGWVSSGLIVIVEETPVPDDSSSGKRIASYAPAQDEPEPTDAAPVETAALEPDSLALQWYGMNIGIVGAFLVIGFGALTGILRAIFVRRKTS